MTAGGGVCAYIDESIKTKLINGLPENNLEQLWLSLTISGCKYVFGVTYRPPSKSVLEFCEDFENCLNYIVTKFDITICVGDFNIDALDSNSNAYKKLYNILDSLGLSQIVHEPTRFSSTNATAIDLVICTESEIKIVKYL